MAVELDECRSASGILGSSSHHHGPPVASSSPTAAAAAASAATVGATTAAQLKMQKLACSGGGSSPCPQSVSPLLPPTPPGSRSPPSSRLSPSPHQQQNNTQPQKQQQQQQQEQQRPQQHEQQRLLPFSIDNILKPTFGNSKPEYERPHSSRSPEPPELLLRTPPKTPDVPTRHDSPVDLSHKASSLISNGFPAGLGLSAVNKTSNELLLSHSINLLIGPHSTALHPFKQHLQQTLLQQQQHQAAQAHPQHPIISKPIPLSTTTAFQLLRPLNNFAEQQRRLHQQHQLEHQQHQLQQQQQQLRLNSPPHLKPSLPHPDHLQSATQSVNQHKILHQHHKDQQQPSFKDHHHHHHQQQNATIQHQTILHQNNKTPLPAPSPTPSTCSTTSSCSSTTSSTTGCSKNIGSSSNIPLSPGSNSSKQQQTAGSKGGNDSSLEELVNPKIPEDNSNWPAWVYCTRYSDRPSSGGRPRSRRVKRHDRNPEEKRPRTAFTSDQLNRLKKEFEDNKYLTEKRRQDLARELGLNESQIKIWFQNKRAKIKKSSGPRSGLAQHLMAQGLYNHCTVPVDEDDPYLS